MTAPSIVGSAAGPEELAALLALTRRALAALLGRPLPPPPAAGADMLPLAVRHQLIPLLQEGLSRAGWDGIDGGLRAGLGDMAKRQAPVRLAQVAALGRLSAAFEAEGVRWLALKGPAVSARLFGSPCIRHSGDLDILVPPGSLPDADRAVSRLGFARLHPAPGGPPPWERRPFLRWDKNIVYRDASGTLLECHWRPFINPTLLEFDFDEAWERRDGVTLGAHRVALPGPAHLFLHLAGHGAAHSWMRLKWLADIAALLPSLTGDQAAEAARLVRRHGLETMARHTVGLSAALLDAEVPAPLRGLGGSSAAVGLLDRLARRAIAAPVPPKRLPLDEILLLKLRNVALKPTLATLAEVAGHVLFRPGDAVS